MDPHPGDLRAPLLGSRRGSRRDPESLLRQRNSTAHRSRMRSTRGLSRGLRTRAGSTAKPRAWAYSRKASLSFGLGRVGACRRWPSCCPGSPPRTPRRRTPRRASNPAITSAKRLPVGGPDEHVPRIHRGEDQPVHHPPPTIRGIGEHARAGRSRPAPPRRVHSRPPAPWPAPPELQFCCGIPMQRPIRHHHTAAAQQRVDLGQRQARP